MFGIDREARRIAALDRQLFMILSRNQSIPALDSLINALGTAELPESLSGCTIALDSSVFLRLASDEKSADAIDYLNTQHSSGIVLPGQSVQEFWNNRYNVVPSLAKSLKSSFDSFYNKIEELDSDFSAYKERFDNLILEFEYEHGHVFDEQTISKTFRMLDGLKSRALVPYVNREMFQKLAANRQSTKTPPGFRDKQGNDGDFFVWLDTLRGVQLISKKARPTRLVFVTNDKKDDWSRDGMPHPVLAAELRAVCGLKLCILDLKKFLTLVERTTG